MVVTRRMAKQAASANTHTSSNMADNDDRSTNAVIGKDTAGAVANVRASSRRRGAKGCGAPKAIIHTEDSTVGILPLSPVRGSQTNKRRRGHKQTECTNRRATAKIGGSNSSANMNSSTTSDKSALKQVQKRRMESSTDKENIAGTAHDATALNERRVRQRVDKAGDDAKGSVYIQDTSSAGAFIRKLEPKCKHTIDLLSDRRSFWSGQPVCFVSAESRDGAAVRENGNVGKRGHRLPGGVL